MIVRTAAEGASEDELARDVKRLQAQWEDIQARAAEGGAPALLYEEPDLVIRVVRDLFNEDFRELVVQGDEAYGEVESYLAHVSPDLVARLHRHTGTADVFAEQRIDEQILKGLDRKVFLPSGGHLVIDRTEAMTVVDVNTGKYTGAGGNLEETVTRNNLEAAEEIVRQLRLRDLGGIVVIDFIDMVLESQPRAGAAPAHRVPRPGPDQAPGHRDHLARPGADDPQADRRRPAGGVQRDLRALQGPRRDHPHRAGAGEAGRRTRAPGSAPRPGQGGRLGHRTEHRRRAGDGGRGTGGQPAHVGPARAPRRSGSRSRSPTPTTTPWGTTCPATRSTPAEAADVADVQPIGVSPARPAPTTPTRWAKAASWTRTASWPRVASGGRRRSRRGGTRRRTRP